MMRIWNFGRTRTFPTSAGDMPIPHGAYITTDNEEILKTLRRHSRLKFVEQEKEIGDMNKAELVAKAKERNIAGAARLRKAELITAIKRGVR